MSKILKNLAIIALFLVPRLSFGMEPEAVKIQTSNAQEFDVPLDVAQTSETLKNMIEDIGEKVEQSIPLANISGQQFDLLLPAMKNLALLPMAELKASEEELAQQRQQIVSDLKPNDHKQFIGLFGGINHLDLPILESAVQVLAPRILPAIQKLAELPMTELQASKEELARQRQQIVTDLKSNEQPLNNQQFIELVAGINYLDLPILEPALQTLAHRILNKEEWLKLESLGDKLKDLWHVHPAKKLMVEAFSPQPDYGAIAGLDGKKLISWSYITGTIKIWDKNNHYTEFTLQHPGVSCGVIENRDGKKLISWGGGNIKIWDKNNLVQAITLPHPGVYRVVESLDGKYLISWGGDTIKIWDKNNLAAKPITLEHPGVSCGIESLDGKNLISRSKVEGTIKIWDKTEPITLEHTELSGVIESMDDKKLISWTKDGKSLISWGGGTVKLWDMALLDPTPKQIFLLLAVYFMSEGNQKFELPAEKLSELKATFNMLSSITQASLEKQAPDFVAVIRNA